MGLLLALLALGSIYFVTRSAAASSTTPADKQIAAGDSLDARFEAALADLKTDPALSGLIGLLMSTFTGKDATEAEVKTGIDEGAKSLKKHWDEKDPHALAEDAIEFRSHGAEFLAASKSDKNTPDVALAKKYDAASLEKKTRKMSDILREKIETLTKQGKNLDAAFASIDAGKPMSEDAMLDAALIDKAALSPFVFVAKTPGILGEEIEGDIRRVEDLASVGHGTAVIDRTVGVVKKPGEPDLHIVIGKVGDFTLTSPAPDKSYFGAGTNVYVSFSS